MTEQQKRAGNKPGAGRPKSLTPNKVSVTLMLDADVYDKLKADAARDKQSVSALANEIIAAVWGE